MAVGSAKVVEYCELVIGVCLCVRVNASVYVLVHVSKCWKVK